MNMKLATILLIAATMFGLSSYAEAQETCEIKSQDVNTPVPKELEEAKIIIRTKDGKEQEMRAEDYKVVKRKQQFKVKEVTTKCEPVIQEVIVKEDGKLNILMGGLRYDHTDLSSSASGNTIRLYSEKSLVFDISYYRRRLFDTNVGAGIGIDTNVTPRGFLGYEF